ncbi:ankyrin repeat-containing domain protein [Diaporthe sp. PMI_573]|nr:ankyrin repeat-containing domain protein [Diaporthaceae sp. PMI_573]
MAGQGFFNVREAQARNMLVLLSWIKPRPSNLAFGSLNDLVSGSAHNIFSRSLHPTSEAQERENQVNTALKLLLHCLRPFTVAELYDLERTTTYGQQIGFDEALSPGHDSAATLGLLPGLVTICENQVVFGHAQLRDYLFSDSRRDTEGGGRYRAHAEIADWCLQYLHMVAIEDWPVVNADQETNGAPEYRGSFRSYAVRHWVEHARLAGRELGEWPAFDELLNKPELLEHWTNAYWSHFNPATRGDPASMTTLAIFARHGADVLLSAAMSKFQAQTSFGEQCFGALSWAALEGQLSAVTKLAAIPRPDGTTLDRAILGAITSARLEVIHKVVNLAAQQPNTLRDPLVILGWAAYYDLVDIVRILIHTVPAGESRRRGFLPLIMCAAGSFRSHTGGSECLKLLINAQFAAENDDDKVSGAKEIALSLACRHGNRAIALVLVEALCQEGHSSDAKDDGDPEEGQSISTLTKGWHGSFLKAIQTAVTYGQHAMVEELLEFALAQGWRDTSALTNLCNVAFEKQRVKSLRFVISHLANTVEAPRKKEISDFLLHATIKLKDKSLVQQVINSCGISDAVEFSSILCDAVDGGDSQEEVVKMLIEEGERVFRETSREQYYDAINTACSIAVEMRHLALLKVILSKGPSLSMKNVDGRTPLFDAAWGGHEGMVQMLINAKADPNAPGDEEGWTPLQGAYDEARISKILLKAGAKVDRKTTGGRTPLTLACVNECVDTIDVLLRYKANPNYLLHRETPLSMCLVSRSIAGVSKLLEAGADPTLFSASELEHPLLHYCVRHGLSDALELLLLYNISVDEQDGDQETALGCITSETTVSAVKLLLRRGASVDPETDAQARSHTPLSRAVSAGNYAVADYLIRSGANVNAKSGDFGSVLHAACRSGTHAIISMLVEAGADINYKYPGEAGTPLHAALRNQGDDDDRMEIVTYLLSQSDIDEHQTCDWWGSVLSIACLECDLDMVRKLTDKRVDVNAEDRIGRKPIHFALYRTLDMVEYLIDVGAQLQSKDRMGRGALHFAVVSGDTNIVDFLLTRWPQLVHERDNDDWTPLLWAMRICDLWDTQSSERTTIIQLLIKCGADRLVEGDGLDRKWTAYGLATYYALGDAILDLVTPTHAELEAMESDKRVRFQYVLKAEKKRARCNKPSYCDACLMCYRSRNEIHPDHTFSEIHAGREYVSNETSLASSTASDASDSDLGDIDNNSIDANSMHIRILITLFSSSQSFLEAAMRGAQKVLRAGSTEAMPTGLQPFEAGKGPGA